MLLEHLPQAELDAIHGQSTLRTYPRDSILFSRGDTPSHLHILVSGVVTICNYTPNGERKVITTISTPGDCFGEVYLFLNAQAYEFFAVAERDCTVEHIPKELAFSNPSLMAKLLQLFAQKAYVLNRRIQILSGPTLRERLLIYIDQMKNQQNQVYLPHTRDALADLLNTTRPSLSRELMNMQQEGLILVEKKRITKLTP